MVARNMKPRGAGRTPKLCARPQSARHSRKAQIGAQKNAAARRPGGAAMTNRTPDKKRLLYTATFQDYPVFYPPPLARQPDLNTPDGGNAATNLPRHMQWT